MSGPKASADHPVWPGQVIAGKYRVDRTLGEGGMGIVVAATDLQLERKVAVKVMQPSHAKSADAVERFLREGKAAVKLMSEHVARVYDVGETPEGAPYLV